MSSSQKKLTGARLRALLRLPILFVASAALSQTVENPIDISMSPLNSTISPGQRSAVILVFRVPRGFWLGDNDPSARNPSGTIIEMEAQEHFEFEQPLFPTPVVTGVPVHKGVTNIFEGEVHVIVPYTTSEALPSGEYNITANITYTPGLNAGHVTTHIREQYSTTVAVTQSSQSPYDDVPVPSVGEVPANFLRREEIVRPPEPWNTMLYRWPEDTPIPNFLHWMWVDPENHGKHIQTLWTPFGGIAENTGNTIGLGVALVNATREGIMTGLLQVRGYYNEFVGNTIAMEAVSCPAAYFNYWFSGQISDDGRNRQIHFHIENLTLGERDRFGYDLQLDAFQEPRSRFYGIGAGTKEENKTNYTNNENSVILDLFWLPVDHLRIAIGGKVRSVDVKEGADKLRGKVPFTTTESSPGGRFAMVPGIKGATVVGERLSLMYDSRNREFSPTDGFFGRMTAEYDQVTDQVITSPEQVSRYGRFSLDLRKYFSTADQKMTLVLRNSWTFTTSENIPFFDQATFGGDLSDRGFDVGRFYGQHSAFGSMEFRYQLMHIGLMGFPMEVEMAPFLDFGQVFDSNGLKGRFNVNPGMSIRILNPPNVGIVANGAIGQDGIILTGGVQLPF